MQAETVNKAELIAIRDFREEDKNLIYASWLIGLYYGDSWFSEVPKNVFMEHYHKVIGFILDKESTKIRIACLKEDPNVILGYSVLKDNDGIHWVFVKKPWRGIGLANDLVRSCTYATHLTKVGLSILKKKNLIFNPFNL